MVQNEILISQGDRPWWQRVIAAIFFTGMFIFLYYFLTSFNIYDSGEKLKSSVTFLQMAIFLFAGGVSFSIFRDYHFNFKEKKYKILICIGPFKIGRWKRFENLEYISVFKNTKGIFEINLWYNRNKHFNLSIHSNADTALFLGKEISKRLEIELLDATNPHHSKWIDKNH